MKQGEKKNHQGETRPLLRHGMAGNKKKITCSVQELTHFTEQAQRRLRVSDQSTTGTTSLIISVAGAADLQVQSQLLNAY